MKQYQFEVKNKNILKKELARVKRFSKNQSFGKVFFQIYTCIEDIEQIKEITAIIDAEFPESFYYGCQTFGNICEGHLATVDTIIVCTVFEYETTKAQAFFIDPSDEHSKNRSLDDLWRFCNENSWVKSIEITTSFHGADILGIGGKIDHIRDDILIFGGVACNPRDLGILDTYVFAKGYEPSCNAAIAIVIGGDDIYVEADVVTGWEALGKSFEVTSCEGNIIKTIDNEPAMNIYKKYLGVEQGSNFGNDGMMFPLLVEENGIENLRIPTRGGEQGEIGLMVDAQMGQKVRLSYGDKDTIVLHARKAAKKMADFCPDSIRICSCAARRGFWGDAEISRESEMFDILAPTVGFYTRGELIRRGDYINFLNSTMVISLLREGDAFGYGFDVNEEIDKEPLYEGLVPKLINYISAVTEEIEGQFNSTMRGIANNYRNMFLIDLEEETLTQIDSNKRDEAILAQKENYWEKMKFFIRTTVAVSMQYNAVEFCDFNTIRERLQKTEAITAEFVGKLVGWFRAQIVVVDRDYEGNPVKIVFATQVIDAEKRAAEEQKRVIQSLADSYFTLHVFDLKKDIVAELSSQTMLHEKIENNRFRGCKTALEMAIKRTVSEEFLEQMLTFTDFSTLSDRMQDKKSISAEFVGFNGWTRATFIVIDRDNAGNLAKVLFATKLVDDEKKKEESLIRNANTDELTGLFNRRCFDEDLEKAKLNGLPSKNVVLIGLDINGLKTANDTLGHAAGDELIIGTAECIKQCMSSYGKTYRVGGDEFFASLYVDEERFAAILDDFENTVSEWKGKLIDSLSISIGYVFWDGSNHQDVEELVLEADKKMYAAKEAFYKNKGRDRRGKRSAYEILCDSFNKIVKANLTTDSFELISADQDDLREDLGYDENSLSAWFMGYANAGGVDSCDVELFKEKTDIDYLKEFFAAGNKYLWFKYKRLYKGVYKTAIIEMMPSRDYTLDQQTIYMYVKIIEE